MDEVLRQGVDVIGCGCRELELGEKEEELEALSDKVKVSAQFPSNLFKLSKIPCQAVSQSHPHSSISQARTFW